MIETNINVNNIKSVAQSTEMQIKNTIQSFIYRHTLNSKCIFNDVNDKLIRVGKPSEMKN